MDSKDQKATPAASTTCLDSKSRPPPIGASSTTASSSPRAPSELRSKSVSSPGVIGATSHLPSGTQPTPTPTSLEWEGPHPVLIPRGPSGFGFTLRHLVVYPPQSVLDDDDVDYDDVKEDGDYQSQAELDGLLQHRPPQRQLSLEPQDTIFVRTVKEGSPAELSGLCTGDRLVAVNGDSVTGKPYHQIIDSIHNSGSVLKLLVVPKDEDILQMAYPFQAGNSYHPSITPMSDVRVPHGLKDHHHFYSQSSLDTAEGRPTHKGHASGGGISEYHDVRYSFPLSGMESQEIDYRLGASESQAFGGANQPHQDLSGHRFNPYNQPHITSQEQKFKMTCNVPSKSKYSFGLYFPPKTTAPAIPSGHNSNSSNVISAGDRPDQKGFSKPETFEVKQRLPASSASRRKSSLDETSVLSASAKSRDYFIRYSTDKAASDNRNRYSPRHSAYERYPSESHPDTYICRSQTISGISATKPSGQPVSHPAVQVSTLARHYVPVHAESKLSKSSDTIDHRVGSPFNPSNRDRSTSVGASSFVVRIPFDQQQQQSSLIVCEPPSTTLPLVRQSYGTTFALTRSPTAAHIEIQKSIGKPIVSQRKYQFEIAATTEPAPGVTPVQSSSGNLNRYKTEIEKIRTQPKFSSIAMRKASFEQSPDRDSPSYDDSEDMSQREDKLLDTQPARLETAQPTIKVRKISSERYNSGAPLPSSDVQERSGSNIRIFVSPGHSPHKSSSPVVEIGIDSYKKPIVLTQTTGQYPSQLQVSDSTSENSGRLLQATSLTAPSSSPILSKDSIYRGPPSSAGSQLSLGGDSTTGLADSGVWVKSYHSSSSTDMLDGVGAHSIDSSSPSSVTPAISTAGTGSDISFHSLERVSHQDNLTKLPANRPPRKTSYLSAVNAPSSRTPLVSQQSGPVESHSNLMQTPQTQLALSQVQAQALPQSSSLLSADSQSSHPPLSCPLPHSETTVPVSASPTWEGHPSASLSVPSSSLSLQSSSLPSSGSSQSIHSISGGASAANSGSNVPVASVVPTVIAISENTAVLGHQTEGPHHTEVLSYTPSGEGDISVTMRKKMQESLEDQANKLHRRTSYLMATARDRTNTVPIEQAFSRKQSLIEHNQQQIGGTVRHQSSVKLNKFFGEMIPSIAEAVEIVKSTEGDESPEIIRRGPLSCKISVIEGKKCSDRSWKPVFAILRQTELFLTREKDSPASVGFEDQHIPLRSIMVEFARDYAKKKKHVFRMSTHNECEYLFQTEDRGTMLCWIQAIKSINEPDQAGKMDEMIATERERQLQAPPIEINVISTKMSPQIGGHKGGRKLSALSLKAKLSSSPSMRRKKSGPIEKDESIKKTWMGRIAMMKSLKKSSEDSSSVTLSEHEGDLDKMQFGVRLEDCFPSPHNQYVPLIVELCTRIVEARGLEVVGVYRVPGNSAAINALTEEFNRGIDAVNIDNEKLLDINVISSLLKSFFRKLEEPLVPAESYDNFIEANRHPDEGKRKLKLKRLLHLLPPHHHETFRHMAEHLNKVASYGNINKMDAKNLAIMFGPTLVRKKEDDTVSLVTDMSDQCRIVESIILHHDWFFSTWDQDNYIPMETTVETVNLEEGQNSLKDDDEEADSAISTKELISSIVGAASKKLRSQKLASSRDNLDGGDITDSHAALGSSPGTFSEFNADEEVYLASLTKSSTGISSSSRSASDECLDKKISVTLSSAPGSKSNVYGSSSNVAPVAPIMASSNVTRNSKQRSGSSSSEPYFHELQYADATSNDSSRTPPSPSLSSSTATGATNVSRYFSDESLLAAEHFHDSNDELDDEMEFLHPGGRLPTSLSRDAIHDTLKRIGNDVSALLHTFEQKQQKERERRRREQERVEAEHRRTRLELEQEDFDDSFDSWLMAPSWKGAVAKGREGGMSERQLPSSLSGHAAHFPIQPSHKMPDVVSSSYVGEHYPYDHQERISSAREKEKLDMDNRREFYLVPKVASNISLPPQPPSMTISSPPQGAVVSLPSNQVDSKLKQSHGSSDDFLLSDLHIQEEYSPKAVKPHSQSRMHQQETQLRQRQQFPAGGEKGLQKSVSSLRQSYGRRHGSLDSLIDMIDKDKRASWASSDSEDGSDLLTSITTTFDQKLQILLNPKYKLNGAGKKTMKNDASCPEAASKSLEQQHQVDNLSSRGTSSNLKQGYTMAALLDSDRSFQDPSLHRSAKSDPKIGIASRFERVDRAASSSPKSFDNISKASQLRKRDLPDFRSFLGKSAAISSQQRDSGSVVLTQPKKLESGNVGCGGTRIVRRNSGRNGRSDSSRSISKSEKMERNLNLLAHSGHKSGSAVSSSDINPDLDSTERGDKENLETPEQVRNRKNQHRRHTVGGAEDFEHISALSHINDNRNVEGTRNSVGDGTSLITQQQHPSAWEQLRPALKYSGPGSMQAWIQRERLRGSTPDLSCKQDKTGSS